MKPVSGKPFAPSARPKTQTSAPPKRTRKAPKDWLRQRIQSSLEKARKNPPKKPYMAKH